ncbi:hypothetical protein [Pseudomonas putida]|uniref:hypothetical protein n=1 Tax=Pseudomonas putida TaxID=303 RepID=UPI0039DF6058
MIQRFVVVPAIPIETGSIRNGTRFHSTTVPGGFDIYDNQDKQRLQFTYPTQIEADAECERLNRPWFPRHSPSSGNSVSHTLLATAA